jgi:glycosyltransferase involved in cell wall biosynthesis
MLSMGRAAARADLDVMYFPSSYSFFPVWNIPLVVVTIFDALPLTHPEWVFPSKRGRLLWTLKERAAVAFADRILTTSESSRRDLVRCHGLDAEDVGKIGAAPDELFRPIRSGPEAEVIMSRYDLAADERFLLYVGGLSPHKNLPRLIEAFARGAKEPWNLVIVGDPSDVFHTNMEAIRDAIQLNGLRKRVRLVGFVPDADLVHLYNRAYALVQPSLLEGFGLPPVESMACGTPVLSSNAGSLPEVVGDAGLFFDPTDVDEMSRTISRLLDSPQLRAELAGRASARAAGFSWETVAGELLAHLEQLASKRKGGRSISRSA